MEDLNISETNKNEQSTSSFNIRWIIVLVLFGFWMVGMSIIIAGWLISNQIAKNNQPYADDNASPGVQQVNVEVPAGVPVLGDNNAKVTIIEFADFQCPFCSEWQKNVFPELKSKYIDTGKARFLFMDYAFLGDESVRAAQAARCAADQSKFWEYHDILYNSQNGENAGAFVDANLVEFARKLNLNVTDFNTCLFTEKHKGALETDQIKISQLGIQSTPTVLINGYKLEGVRLVSDYSAIIDAELAK